MIPAIVTLLRHLPEWAVSAFRSREDLILETIVRGPFIVENFDCDLTLWILT